MLCSQINYLRRSLCSFLLFSIETVYKKLRYRSSTAVQGVHYAEFSFELGSWFQLVAQYIIFGGDTSLATISLIGFPFSHFYINIQRERMQNITTPVQLLNSTSEYNITPKLPEIPLHQEISQDLGIFFYIFITIVCIWLLLYLGNCFSKSHKYHESEGLPSHERLQRI